MPNHNKGRTTRDVALSLQTEERRKIVAANLVAGASYRDIAEHLGVGKSTVNRDVKALKEQWYQQAQEDIEQFMGLHARRLDRLLYALMEKALNGDVKAVDRVLAIMDRQAALHGVPTHFNLGTQQQEQDDRLDSIDDFMANKDVRAIQLREVMIAFADDDGHVEGFESDLTVE